MKVTQETYEALAVIYSPGEIAKAKQRLTDTKTEAERWAVELADEIALRETLADAAVKECPEIKVFVEYELEFRYHQVSQIEGKLATCRRRIEELESFLRRAARVRQWTT